MKVKWTGTIGLAIVVGILNFTPKGIAADEPSHPDPKREKSKRILELLNDVASPSSTDPEEEKAHISRVLRLYELEFIDGGFGADGKKTAPGADDQEIFLDLTDSINELRMEIAELRKQLDDRSKSAPSTAETAGADPLSLEPIKQDGGNSKP